MASRVPVLLGALGASLVLAGTVAAQARPVRQAQQAAQAASSATQQRSQQPAPAQGRPQQPAPAQPQPARPGQPAPARGAQPAAPARAQAEAASDTTVKPLDYLREVFSYQGGTRDPFKSLIQSTDVRPTITDLKLVAVAYDPRYPDNSVAVVREAGNPRPHRLRRGSQIGRLRVLQIRPYEVVFQVEEFGFERQEVLTLTRRGVTP